MLLYLLRHAEAADGTPDADRPLTPKGSHDVEKLGKHLQRQGVKIPSTIWCSPFQRARTTAEILTGSLVPQAEPQFRDGLTPYDDPAQLLPELAEIEEDLLLVGHNPHLSMLAGYLLGGLAGDVVVHYRKCMLMRFERIKRYTNDPNPTWVLDWALPPKIFR